ncbi:hypothetical protein CR513_50306, partial [Mucuna pruriens]
IYLFHDTAKQERIEHALLLHLPLTGAEGSVDNKFATCAAEASKPSRSSGASSEMSPTSNPKGHERGKEDSEEARMIFQFLGRVTENHLPLKSYRRINITCLQESKWNAEKSKELDTTGFKVWYLGKVKENSRLEFGRKESVVDVKRDCESVLSLKLMGTWETINIIRAYVPQVGFEALLKEKFDRVGSRLSTREKILIGGDINRHVGSEARQFIRAYGGFSFGDLNKKGQTNLKIANCFLLVRSFNKRACKDCKMILGESSYYTTQGHKQPQKTNKLQVNKLSGSSSKVINI